VASTREQLNAEITKIKEKMLQEVPRIQKFLTSKDEVLTNEVIKELQALRAANYPESLELKNSVIESIIVDIFQKNVQGYITLCDNIIQAARSKSHMDLSMMRLMESLNIIKETLGNESQRVGDKYNYALTISPIINDAQIRLAFDKDRTQAHVAFFSRNVNEGDAKDKLFRIWSAVRDTDPLEIERRKENTDSFPDTSSLYLPSKGSGK
jgi:hypothetical protein